MRYFLMEGSITTEINFDQAAEAYCHGYEQLAREAVEKSLKNAYHGLTIPIGDREPPFLICLDV